uniref:Expansin-like EG45 domain-containing protein n=1 Tax=Oryza punctata TaxID=4537 RepID=A0A0E0LFT9_ORYPU
MHLIKVLEDAGGACGFGAAPMELNVAAVTADLFRHGHACAACYQLRCRDRRLCGEDGVKVVVADMAKQPEQEGEMNRTAGASLQFRITKDAFAAMAKQGVSAHELTSHHTLEVDFRRIPCEYKKSRSLTVRVEEASKNPTHLAIRFLYQGGQTDIAAVEIAQANATPSSSYSSWRYMTRREGGAPGVWTTSRAPAGPLRLRVVVTAGSGGKWLRSDGEVLPADWKAGEVYDTGLRVTDVAVRSCSLSCAIQDRDSDDGQEELR